MATQTFSNQSSTSLGFSNISVTETDVGTVFGFLGNGNGNGNPPTLDTENVGPYQTLDFNSFSSGAINPGSSIQLDFSYDVSSNVPGLGISSLQQSFVANVTSGTVHLTIAESVYDSNNHLVGSTFTSLDNPSDPTSVGYTMGDLLLSQVYGSLHVKVTVIASVDASAANGSRITFSEVEQGFGTAPLNAVPLPGSLSGHVFLDQNADGTQATVDGNLAGVMVQLLDSNGQVIVGSTAVTDANGAYTFNGLTAGNYAVKFTAPSGDSFSPAGSTLPSATTSIAGANGTTAQFAVAAGATTTNINAGVYAPAIFNTHVYIDTNKDSSQGAGEANAPGVTVSLLKNGVATGTTAITDANGNVSFTGLIPGSYSVTVGTPAGDTVTQATNVGTPVTLVSGQTATATEGLFVPASLGGHIFVDGNDNGVQDAGDANLAGVTVSLLNSAGTATGVTAITDANGAYSFTGLIPGSYAVKFTAPGAYKFDTVTGTNANAAIDSIVNTSGQTAQVTVVGGANTPNQNAGVFLGGTFTTHVYIDTNKDSTQGGGEANAPGVVVSLLSNGTPTGLTAVTDANGNVRFTGLIPGSYSVTVGTPAGDIVTQATNIGTPVTIGSGQTVTATEGLFIPGTLSGHIFVDGNDNGVQESGDANLAGVTVTLLNSAGASTGVTAITDANGFYQFTGLIPGSYAVAFTAPGAYKFDTVIGTNANLAVDSIVNTVGQTAQVSVTAGNTTVNQNAGVFLGGTFTTHLYTDTNKDSSQTPGEADAPGVTVSLLSNGTPTGLTAVTDANGNVSFTGLIPGSYSVTVGTPTGSTVTQATNVGTPVTIGSGQTVVATEGLFVPASLSGHIFVDGNDNGVQESGDTNVSGVTVSLLNSAGTATGLTAITDANGFYQFTNLIPGTYAVKFTAPGAYKFDTVKGTNANAAIDSIVDTTGQTVAVAVVAGATTPNQNAGIFLGGTFTTHVYIDTNKDSTQGGGEANAPGVTVSLLSNGSPTGLTAVTDANGNVSFTGLIPGSYSVTVGTPTGDTVTQATNIGTPVTIGSGQTVTATEGLFIPGALSGHIFVDGNDNGVQDSGDTNLAGVTVTLLNSAGASTGVTAITDANGFYQFTGLIPGSYAVAFTAPGAYKFDTVIGTNANAAVDSIVNTVGKTAQVSVTAGNTTVNQNAGVFLGGTFTTHVYTDTNKDSSQTPGEANAPGVTVSLLSNGTPTGLTAVTDANGNVSFTGLIPGSYSVTVGTPTGSTVTQATNIGTPVTIGSGQTVVATEGLFVPASLSGHIFVDVNDNGVQESGDTNVSGVTVSLLNSSGAATGVTAITDANGFYQFTNLIPGTYAVKFTAPGAYKFDTVTGTNSNAAIDSIVNTAGQTAQVAVVAGATTPNQNAGIFLGGTFTTHVYTDTNKDSTQGGGEANAPGVVVSLLSNGTPTGLTAVTDGNGNVSFTGLIPGSYSVTVGTPAGSTVTQATNVGTPVTIGSGQTVTATEGLFVPASLSGHIFVDQNDNGVQESGDTNVSGVSVSLLNNAGTATGVTAITDANGFYQFTNLVAGSYAVKFSAPGVFKFDTVVGTNSNAAVDSIVNTTGQTNQVTVVAGAATLNQNAGIFAPVTITEHVYLDNNINGTQDGGDVNLAGVTVNLFASNGTTLLGTALTDANGNVSFTGYNPGTYVVGAITPTGDGTGQFTNAYWPTSINSGGTLAAIQGFNARGTINTHVYTDANKDNAQNNGEGNLAGVTVNLLNSGGTVVSTAQTDASGNVSFANIAAGTYSVAVVTPAGDIVTQATNVGSTITLAAGQTVTAIEGLFVPASLCGRVFLDYNNNGVFGTAGSAYTLGTNLVVNGSFENPGTWGYAVYCNGQVQGWTSNNNELEIGSSGTYGLANYDGAQIIELNGSTFDTISQTVTGLVVGQTYQLGWAYGGRSGSGNQEMDVLVNGTKVAMNTSNGVSNLGWQNSTVTFVATATSTVISFAAINVGGSCGVGNELDGVTLQQVTGGTGTLQDYGIPNQTVTLLTAAGASTGLTTVTDSAGNYCFTNLVAGTYSVQFTPLSGAKFDSVVGTNANPALNSIVNTSGLTPTQTVVAGATTYNVNAGEYLPVTFTTHVYTDANKDKVQNSGDSNLSGVTVSLLTGAGVATGATAVTDANGNVSFTGLAPGSYQVAVTTPTGTTVTQATNVSTTNTLYSGQSATAIEGITSAIGALSGRIFGDFNGDGVFNTVAGTDFGLAGQTVQLLNSSGGVVTGVTATTDGNGNYSFTNLAAGTYAVKVNPANSAVNFSSVGTNANAALDSVVNSQGVSPYVQVVAGATTQNVNAGEYTGAVITTHVYADTNSDGTQGTNEAAKAGITVNLLTGAGAATGRSAVTDSSGNVTFDHLAPGTYKVDVVEPSNMVAKQLVNVDSVITLTQGQTVNAIEGLVSNAPSLSIQKTASVSATTPGNPGVPPLTYTFKVTNTGTTALTGVKVVDVTNGDPATAVTYTDPNTLAAGATWTYTTAPVTVAATKGTVATLGSGKGFDLGDSATYGVIAFNPGKFTECSTTPLIGNVGLGSFGSVSVGGGGVAGNFVTTGATPTTTTTSWNWATWCNQTVTTNVVKTSGSYQNDGKTTSYGTVGWGENWADESGNSNNCYSSFGCNGSTGSSVWDSFWNQTCTTSSSCDLVLKISENAWNGHAQFTVSVDGCQVGGTYTATTANGCGSQSINLGSYSTTNHVVKVNFLNDAYGGSSSADRNLYVDGLTFNGLTTQGASLCSNGAVSFNVGSTSANNCNYTSSVCGADSDDTWGNYFQNCSTSSCYNTDYAGEAYNIVANSTSLAADIASLKTLSTTLFAETGKSVALGSGTTLNATSGILDATGNEVFTVTSWSTNFSIVGDGSHAVVLNVAANQSLNLGNINLSGGISANQVLVNYTGTNAVTDASGTTTNATILAANAKITIDSGTINGHVYGGAANQDFTINSNGALSAPALQSYSLTDVATASGTSNGTTVSAFDTAAVTINPIGAGVSNNCNAPSSCDNLWTSFGQLQKLELCFNPGTSVHTNGGGWGITSGNCNTGSTTPCFITVTNSASDSLSGCKTYFQGSVAAGDKFYCDSSQLWNGASGPGSFSTNAGDCLFVHVFASQADCNAGNAAVQNCAYDVSGSHAISLGDQIGCVSVAGYVSTSGHGYVC